MNRVTRHPNPETFPDGPSPTLRHPPFPRRRVRPHPGTGVSSLPPRHPCTGCEHRRPEAQVCRQRRPDRRGRATLRSVWGNRKIPSQEDRLTPTGTPTPTTEFALRRGSGPPIRQWVSSGGTVDTRLKTGFGWKSSLSTSTVRTRFDLSPF